MFGDFQVDVDIVGQEWKEVAGTILVTALVFGLGIGSLLGPSLVSLI